MSSCCQSRYATAVGSLLAAIVGLGCTPDRQPAPSSGSSAVASVGIPSRSSEHHADSYADASLPDEADFANQADQQITEDSYEAKLAELEIEVAAADDAGATEGKTPKPVPSAHASHAFQPGVDGARRGR